MIQRDNKIQLYNAQGFVEALIAILVAGLATMVLMSVAIKTLNSVVKNELTDQLTQEAVKGAELLTYAVDDYNYGKGADTTTFLPIDVGGGGNLGSCYKLDGEFGAIEISEAIPGCYYYNEGGDDRGIVPDECPIAEATISESAFIVGEEKNDIFRLMCIHPDSTNSVLVAKILTGETSCTEYSGFLTETVGQQDGCNSYEHTAVYLIDTL